MSELYIKKSFTQGNFKAGDLEFVFGLGRAVAKQLTGSEMVNDDCHIGIAQCGSRTRLYGLEMKSIEALAVLLPPGFVARSVHCVQDWFYRSGTTRGGVDAAMGGFATRSSNMPTWNDDVDKERIDLDELIFGPGFVEFSVPSWTIKHHGGRQAKFDPYQTIRELASKMGVSFSEDKEALVIYKRKAT